MVSRTLSVLFLVALSIAACDEQPPEMPPGDEQPPEMPPGDEQPPEMPPGLDFYVGPGLVSDSLRLAGVGLLRFRGGIALQSRSERFGTYSGLRVSGTGNELVAVGWGGWLVGTLEYGPSGDLTGFDFGGEFPILDVGGTPVEDDDDQDAEGLTQADGYYYVGFETNNRIWRYSGITGAAEPVALPAQGLAEVPGWGGFSSVVVTAGRQLLALTEGGTDETGNTKGWLWTDEGPDEIWLRAAPSWLPVDLALLPNGDLLLVEVRQIDSGWHSRFSRIRGSDVIAGSVMQARPVGELRPPHHRDRIEGIEARMGSAGEVLVYAISDSRPGWPTSVLMFELERQ